METKGDKGRYRFALWGDKGRLSSISRFPHFIHPKDEAGSALG